MKVLDPDIDRHDWSTLGARRFRDEYLMPLRPVIVRGGFDHWRARNTWTPEFFRRSYGDRNVVVDDVAWKLSDLLDRIENSTAERPAPYLRNEWLEKWPRELRAQIEPMPQCTSPNWLDSKLFPSRDHPTFVELYIGGAGAKFPILHFDNWHTHAFLMQLYGEKEYLAFAPSQGKFLYPDSGSATNKSQINDVMNPDLDRFPLFARAEGIRFKLHPGETLFVPAGWWHTARILSTSITVSINGANKPNWQAFASDYCASIREYSRVKAALVLAYMHVLGEFLNISGQFLA